MCQMSPKENGHHNNNNNNTTTTKAIDQNNNNNGNNNKSSSSSTTTNNNAFEKLPKTIQFILLTSGVFLFFGTHNILQEAMMKVPGFNYGVMLGYMEVIGVTVCSYFERTFIFKETGRVAPVSAYPLLTLCLLTSSALSNRALDYINFPTKVVFRSCKLIPTMMVAAVVNNKHFSYIEYMCAIAVCAGLAFFAAADFTVSPSFNPIGLTLVILSVCADAFLPNAQERLFNLGSSRLEVTLYTNFFTLIAMTITTFMSGDLVGIIKHAMADHQLALYMLIYTSVAYIAISCHMNIVKRFGGVIAVCVATARKGMTLILSFLLFPKEFSWYYVIGGVLVLFGVMYASLIKIYAKKQSGIKKRSNSSDEIINDSNLTKDEQRQIKLELGKISDNDDNEEDIIEEWNANSKPLLSSSSSSSTTQGQR